MKNKSFQKFSQVFEKLLTCVLSKFEKKQPGRVSNKVTSYSTAINIRLYYYLLLLYDLLNTTVIAYNFIIQQQIYFLMAIKQRHNVI